MNTPNSLAIKLSKPSGSPLRKAASSKLWDGRGKVSRFTRRAFVIHHLCRETTTAGGWYSLPVLGRFLYYLCGSVTAVVMWNGIYTLAGCIKPDRAVHLQTWDLTRGILQSRKSWTQCNRNLLQHYFTNQEQTQRYPLHMMCVSIRWPNTPWNR